MSEYPETGAQTRAIVVASGNAGKLAELIGMLEPMGVAVRPMSDFDVEPAEETGTTFFENAFIKAESVAKATGIPALADDSGLEVEALGGAPGVHSARFAGTHGDDAANNALLLEKLDGQDNRRAQFRCCIVVAFPDERAPLIAQGTWPGTIATAPKGDNGFGYDPLFVPDGDDFGGRSAAQLPAAEKNIASHRGQAMRALRQQMATGRQ